MRLITLAVVLTIALLAAAEAQQVGSLRHIGFPPQALARLIDDNSRY
jgi:hypothetical protein